MSADQVRLVAVIAFVALVVIPLLFSPRSRPHPTDAGQQARKREAREYQGFEDGPTTAEPTSGRTRNPETHEEFIGVPRDTGLDFTRLADALNRQDTSVTDHRDQDDDNPGPSWGIIR
jgi:hypothetical protein